MTDEDSPDELHVLIERIRTLDAMDVVRRYDTEFDIPLANWIATGVLRLQAAFEPQGVIADPADDAAADLPTVRFVGAHWCGIVAHDVNYRLTEGLQLIRSSQAAASALWEAWRRRPDDLTDDAAYVLCRWFDGAGKLRYRLGAHARARRSFQAAVPVAERSRLWWALPDLRSNLRRGEFEELRQALPPGPRFQERLDGLREHLTGLAADCVADAAIHGIPLDRPEEVWRDRHYAEFLRGYSSVLHNLAVTLKESGSTEESLHVSQRASRISQLLGDRYREAQAINHQAALAQGLGDRDAARAHYDRVLALGWNRGALIARQNLATLQDEPRTVLRSLRLLADDLARAAGGEHSTDIDIRWYTVNKMADAVRRGRLGGGLHREIEDRSLALAQLMRPVVAIPTYKQEYANQIRPTFLAVASRALDSGKYDDALAHIEESSARDLLDMMASSTLPVLGPPSPPAPGTLRMAHAPVSEPPPVAVRHRRRGPLRRTTAAPDDPISAVLAQRADEFEAALVHNPIEPTPSDPEIMHRVRMFAANHPGTCIVRYFPHGKSISAFVVRGHAVDVVRCGRADVVARLAASTPTHRAPGRRESVAMWEHLLEEVWPFVGAEDLTHLVIVPTDHMFTLPLHLAHVEGDRRRPLGAVVPLSFSVSVTAFVSRARHLLRRQAVDGDDDLAAVVLADGEVTGEELVDNGWRPDRIVVAGTAPAGLPPAVTVHDATWEGMARLTDVKPEFFVYAGHGDVVQGSELGPFLELGDDVITQFDVALRVRLPRNKLTVIGACLAGQGAQAGGGEVAGFLRSLMAAGAGAIALPLWSVLDAEIVRTTRALLAESRRAAMGAGGGIFDVVAALHHHYAAAHEAPVFPHHTSSADIVRAETMPLALYL